MALNESKLNNDQIEYVNAHGTSTQVGDRLNYLLWRDFGSNKNLCMSQINLLLDIF